MTTIEKTGTSVEELIRAFRTEHKIRDWELKYDIIKKPSSGFLGLFSSKLAIVRFHLPGIEDRAALFTETLLAKMGVGHQGVRTKREGKSVYVEVMEVADPGFFIGKNGSMLETIEFLLNRVFEFDRNLDRIHLDAGGYRQRRENTFLRKFLPMFADVRKSGKAVTLDPMTASDRRIIHRHIEGQNGLRTLTVGEGEKKRIVVFSAKHGSKPQPETQSPTPEAIEAPEAKKRPPRRNYRRPNKPKENKSENPSG